eukprot:4662827-Alexandrium_andersonii.AAC.1
MDDPDEPPCLGVEVHAPDVGRHVRAPRLLLPPPLLLLRIVVVPVHGVDDRFLLLVAIDVPVAIGAL